MGGRLEDVWGESSGDDDAACELSREYSARCANFRSAGYREGLSEGKEASLQCGFDSGWKDGAEAGWLWGQARGAAGALRALQAAQGCTLSDEQAQALQALGGGALGVPADALPAVWPHLRACLLGAHGGEAQREGGHAPHASECARPEETLSPLSAQRVRDAMTLAGAHLRTLGVTLHPLEDAHEARTPTES